MPIFDPMVASEVQAAVAAQKTPRSDTDQYYADKDDTKYDPSKHRPTTDRGKAADERFRKAQRERRSATQQRALDDKRTEVLVKKIVPGEVIGRWAVQTEKGSKTFFAVNEQQALREAQRYGLTPTSAQCVEVRKYSRGQLQQMIESIGKPGQRASRRAEFEKAIRLGLVPEDAEFELVGDRDWGYKLSRDPHVYKGSDKEYVYVPPEAKAAQKVMDKYHYGMGYNLVAAIQDGVSTQTMIDAGFDRDTVRETRQWLDKNARIIKALTPYWERPIDESNRTGPHMMVAGYNLDKALKDGAVQPRDLVEVGFDRAVISAAMDRVSIESWPAFRKHEQFRSDIVKAWEKAYPEFSRRMEKADLGFTIDRLLKIHKEIRTGVEGPLPTADALKKLLKDCKAEGVRTPEQKELWEVWHHGADEYKAWLMGLPTEHPEKAALQVRAVKVGMLALACVTPATYAITGSAGRALLVGALPRLKGLSAVARGASGLLQVASLAPVAYTTAGAVGGLRDLESMDRKLDAIQLLPKDEQTYWVQKAGLNGTIEKMSDKDKAQVLATYSVPPSYTVQEWSAKMQEGTAALNKQAAEWSTWLKDNTAASASIPGRVIVNGVAGVGEGMMYLGQLPLIGAMIAEEVPRGNAKQYAAMVAAGMATFFTTDLKGHFQKDPASATGRVVGLFLLSPGALIKYAKGVGVKLDPRFISKRALGTEFTTLRILPPKGTVRVTPQALKKLVDKLVQEAVNTKHKVVRATIKTKAGTWTAEIRNTPYQRVVEGSVFHFTSDISAFMKDIVKVRQLRLHASPQAAIRFAVMSARGQAMKHPGLVEIHLTAKELSKGKLRKLLAKGEAEFEMSLPASNNLHAVPGLGGRGVSFDLRTGTFPIVRFTTSGAKGWKGPSAKLLAKVRVEAAKDAAADFFLGWYGRQLALQELLHKRNPKVERIKRSLDEMKAQQPETIGPNGEILRLRNPVPHPDGKGTMQSRVTGIVRNPETGHIMLVMDKAEAAYGLPGGQIARNHYPGALGFTKGKDGRMYLTYEGALHGQVKSETGVGIKRTEYVGLYRGKVNEHALSGSRVYEAVADGTKLDPVGATRKHGKLGEPTELSSALWWDGKSDITVYPATRDILLAVAKKYGLDMSKVHVYKQAPAVLKKARDRQFFYRVRTNTKLTEKQIAAVNQREISALKYQMNEHLKGEPASLRHFFEGEYDLTDILQLIEGRRRVLKTYETTGRLDATMEGAVRRADLWSKYEKALRSEEGVRANEVAQVYDEAVTRLLDTQLKEPYMDALYAARAENYPAYVTRYLHYYREAARNPTEPLRAVREEYERATRDVLNNYGRVMTYVSNRRPAPRRYELARKSADYPKPKAYTPPSPETDKAKLEEGHENLPYPVHTPKIPPPPETGKRVRSGGSVVLPKAQRKQFPVGDVNWRQGGKDPGIWIHGKPPYQGKPHGDIMYSRRPLPGARLLKGTPEETFFSRGKRLPKVFTLNMGATAVRIRPKDKPHLVFRRRKTRPPRRRRR